MLLKSAQERPLQITIDSPGGPRSAVALFEGIKDEAMLVKSLIMTLAVEGNRGVEHVTLDVDLEGVNPQRLVAIAKAVGDRLAVARHRYRSS